MLLLVLVFYIVWHFLVLLISTTKSNKHLAIFLVLLTPDCAFAGAFFVLLIVLLLVLFCAPDCAFAGAFFVLLIVLLLVLVVVLLIVLLLVLFLCS